MINTLFSIFMKHANTLPDTFEYYHKYSTTVDAPTTILNTTNPFTVAYHASGIIECAKLSSLYSELIKADPMNTYDRTPKLLTASVSPGITVSKFSDIHPYLQIVVLRATASQITINYNGTVSTHNLNEAFTVEDCTLKFTQGTLGTYVIQRPVPVIMPTQAQVQSRINLLEKSLRNTVDMSSNPDLCAAYCLELLGAYNG